MTKPNKVTVDDAIQMQCYQASLGIIQHDPFHVSGGYKAVISRYNSLLKMLMIRYKG